MALLSKESILKIERIICDKDPKLKVKSDGLGWHPFSLCDFLVMFSASYALVCPNLQSSWGVCARMCVCAKREVDLEKQGSKQERARESQEDTYGSSAKALFHLLPVAKLCLTVYRV